ncbi:type VII secretion integral membrane protein EccD [Nonomuraea phyllanthi]|uniref:type VII secretion integral membrane protein EccD n=1 Tax=Nonomuraea phyllanthi TaxID=2219224 RepID=UPI001D00842C|nr:type VII secretion integral membrane protein EccD [Nonomuraea phyllanthi]
MTSLAPGRRNSPPARSGPPLGPAAQGLPRGGQAPLPPLCRVTIVAPRKRVDLALPADVPLPHVLPGVLRAAGEQDGEHASAPGWILQRLGQPPLDAGQSLGALGVLDGEILYLRPRQLVLPPATYDDVADVIALGVEENDGTWKHRHTRLMGIGGAAALLVVGTLALILAGPPWTISALASGVFALLLVAGGAVVSRAAGDSGAGALIGYTALPCGFVAGLLVPAGAVPIFDLGAPHLLAAFAVTALVATIGGVAIGDGVPGFLGTAIASVGGAVSAAVIMLFPLPPAGVVAMTTALMLTICPLVPTLAFRLGGLPMPTMPTTAEELRNDNINVDADVVKERTKNALDYASGMIAGLALMALICQAFLIAAGTWMAAAMSVTLSIALVLRARVFQGVAQRLWLIIAGLGGVAAFAIAMAVGQGPFIAVSVKIALLWIAAIPVGLALRSPDAKPSPFWVRAGDVFEIMITVALFPLALGLLDVYTWVRGLAG